MTLTRRDFSACLLGAGLGGACRPRRQPRRAPVEGIALRPPRRSRCRRPPAGKIEVIEFFWYECPHCNAFEPALEAWAKRLPRRRRVPPRAGLVPGRAVQPPSSASSTRWRRSAWCRRCTARCSHAIHNDRARLRTRRGHRRVRAQERRRPDPVHDDLQLVRGAVARRSRRARLAAAYKIDAVPAMGVHGRYYTNGNLANAGVARPGSNDRMLGVVDALVARVRKAPA